MLQITLLDMKQPMWNLRLNFPSNITTLLKEIPNI
jgi:hypothetical protein